MCGFAFCLKLTTFWTLSSGIRNDLFNRKILIERVRKHQLACPLNFFRNYLRKESQGVPFSYHNTGADAGNLERGGRKSVARVQPHFIPTTH